VKSEPVRTDPTNPKSRATAPQSMLGSIKLPGYIWYIYSARLQGAEEDIGPKRDEVTGEWRKLHKEERRDLYSSPSIIRIIKSRRMNWAGYVARMREKRNEYRLLVESQKERDH
jgi:hypothetical protein